ncbi:MAG: lipopolysaccharide heptosyltransferase II [Deltaproteobacteria bacterium]|jgi:heptosyltransferase-2|nr:lipopolysaccharide heptosyltransferase II [Deltaproteobacteria bacterium]
MSPILVRGLNWLGDAVLSLPAIRAIHKDAPDEDIYVVSAPATSGIYRLAPGVKEVFVDDKKLATRLKLIKDLQALKPEKTIFLPNAISGPILAFLAGLPNRQGYARNGRSFLLRKAIPLKPENRLAHEVFYYLDLLEALGIKAPYVSPRLLAPTDLKIDLPPKFLVALAPGAAYGEAKRYPAAKFAKIAQLLAKELDLAIVILGGPSEIPAAKETLEALGPDIPALNLAGQTSLIEALAVLAKCGLLIANDSGLAHLAGAVDTPLAVLFGPTNPLATGPLGRQSLVLRQSVPCAPCRNRSCPRPQKICFLGLTPEAVAARVLKFLEPAKARGLSGLFLAGNQDQVGPEYNPIVKKPQENLSDFGQKAKALGLNLSESFFMGQDLGFLALGQSLGARTILVANPASPATFKAALFNSPTLALPDIAVPNVTRGLEWLTNRKLSDLSRP